MQPKALNDKLDKIDEMLNKLESAVQDGNPVLDLPSASGLIAECQSECLLMASSLVDGCREKGIPIWLDGRSLLASCRTQFLLPWETSLEFGMYEDGFAEVKQGILSQIGCTCDGTKLKPIEKPKYGRICPEIAINAWIKDKQTLHSKTSEGTAWTTEECILPLEERCLNGMTFPSPAKAWSILEAEYGNGWQKIV